MPARTLYAAQQCKIDSNEFPVQSASCELTVPVDDILILGKLGSAGRFQKEVATCKADVKIFMGNDDTDANAIDGAFLQTLTGQAVAGTVSTVTVDPNGFTMSGIVSSIGLELNKGDYAMADLSFVGVGEPVFADVPTSIGGAGTQPAKAVAVAPITTGVKIYDLSDDLSTGAFNTTCPNSAKFSLDIPNEVISCVGGVISGSQVEVAADNVQVAKPPFKGTITIEGTSAESARQIIFGEVNDVITCTINDPTVTSRSFNQSAGDVGANYSFTVEGSDVAIT
jgi:hypothetical protein